MHYVISLFFFFSSRRRHTRWPRDWSSDVCSSDLSVTIKKKRSEIDRGYFICFEARILRGQLSLDEKKNNKMQETKTIDRSEERRVGKECRYRWSQEH